VGEVGAVGDFVVFLKMEELLVLYGK